MGMLIWRGPSLYDPDVEIALVLTGHERRSSNVKTGELLQTWIVRTDIAPPAAVNTGADGPICGPCPLRALQGCYVQTGKAPLSTWKQQQRRGWVVATEPEIRSTMERFYRRNPRAGLRRGSYGDPAAVPPEVWELILPSAYREQRRADGTGYSHGWRVRPDLASTLMASVHSPGEAREAQTQGWRTFRTMPIGGELELGEVLCPASERAGYRSTCDRCRLCDGRKGPGDRRANVAIEVHGFVSNRAARHSA